MLCQAAVRPRLLLRNPGRLDAGVRDQVELAVGDQRDAGYVAGATCGVEAVFWVHPDDFSLPDPDADAERTGEGLAAAMRQNGIARVVFLSSIGAEKRRGAGFVDGVARIEQRLDAAREETGTALLHRRCRGHQVSFRDPHAGLAAALGRRVSRDARGDRQPVMAGEGHGGRAADRHPGDMLDRDGLLGCVLCPADGLTGVRDYARSAARELPI
jgi:hypothetical protein